MQEILVLGKRTPRITDLCESLEQQQVITWANFMRHKYPELELLHHIPNGGKRSNKISGRRSKIRSSRLMPSGSP